MGLLFVLLGNLLGGRLLLLGDSYEFIWNVYVEGEFITVLLAVTGMLGDLLNYKVIVGLSRDLSDGVY